MSDLTVGCVELTEQAVTWLEQLGADLARSRYRTLLTLNGSEAFAEAVFAQLQSRWSAETVLKIDAATIGTNAARRLLGREFSLVNLRAMAPPSPELLAILAGTLRAGGVLLIEAPAIAWPGSFDGYLHRSLMTTPWALHWSENDPPPALPAWPTSTPLQVDGQGCLTNAQRQALAAVCKVSLGHRRRPLVIRAGRGRGKSALLGLAAAALLKQGKSRILVTAPRREAVDSLFSLAGRQLAVEQPTRDLLRWQQAEIRYLPPDQLLAQQPECDLLLIDEAAAIPAPLLQQVLLRYARVVFATTTQGYEGSGRGFDVRFLPYLRKHAPEGRELELLEPIRWATGDPLEQWLNNTLMLDGEVERIDPIQFAPVDPGALEIQTYSAQQLLADPERLRALFALLVLAHYQTSPNDLRELLQGEAASVALAQLRGKLVGVLFCLDESPLPEALAREIWLGKRRPPGHLLSQTLIAQCGLRDAAHLRARRVVRIAVHPDLARAGIGSRMLTWLAKSHSFDWLGSSFGADATLLPFWFTNGYQPLRLGLKADAASGYPALLVGKPLSDRARDLLAKAQARFGQTLLAELPGAHQGLPPALVIQLLQQLTEQPPVSAFDYQEAVAFACGGRGLEQARLALQRVLLNHPERWVALRPDRLESLLGSLFQYQTVQYQTATTQQARSKGRRQQLDELRSGVSELLRHKPLQRELTPELQALLAGCR